MPTPNMAPAEDGQGRCPDRQRVSDEWSRGEGDSNPRALTRTGLATLRLTGLGHPRSGAPDAVTWDKDC